MTLLVDKTRSGNELWPASINTTRPPPVRLARAFQNGSDAQHSTVTLELLISPLAPPPPELKQFRWKSIIGRVVLPSPLPTSKSRTSRSAKVSASAFVHKTHAFLSTSRERDISARGRDTLLPVQSVNRARGSMIRRPMMLEKRQKHPTATSIVGPFPSSRPPPPRRILCTATRVQVVVSARSCPPR